MQRQSFKGFIDRVVQFLSNPKVVLFTWLLLAVVITVKQYTHHHFNNYLIFKQTYFHAIHSLDLYINYPAEYNDTNHYGPFFSLFIAPFALLPDLAGMLLWQAGNVLFLYFALKKLPVTPSKINVIYWVITHELITALLSFQFNISIAAIIVLAYVYVNNNKNFWAAFVIALGTFIKLYGIVGLCFFFFAKDKFKFSLYIIFWFTVLFLAPMVIFNPQYILDSYKGWYHSLTDKQLLNASLNSMQDISVMGMVRRITGNSNINDLYFLIAGVLLFCTPYLRFKQYAETNFRLYYLAAALIFLVIFSNSSESPTYIIAFTGVAIWFVLQEKPLSLSVICLFIFALLLTSLSPSDLFPKYIRENYVYPYSLKALPCILIWLKLTYELLFKRFHLKSNSNTYA